VSDRTSVSEADAATFEAVRPRLLGIAHRIVGAAADAEDVVQDTWIRWHGTDRRDVRNPAAFLTTTTARLAINVVGSAHVRHETASCAWLSEPIDRAADPTAGAERDEALELAVRTLLQRLSATERAVFVLREAFDYPYRQIADLLELSEPNARQLLVRARARLSDERRIPVKGSEPGLLLDALATGSRTGDLAPLEQLLADEAGANAPLAFAA